MRRELMQMDRMAADERFGCEAGEAMRRMQDIRARMKRENEKSEEEKQDEYLGD